MDRLAGGNAAIARCLRVSQRLHRDNEGNLAMLAKCANALCGLMDADVGLAGRN